MTRKAEVYAAGNPIKTGRGVEKRDLVCAGWDSSECRIEFRRAGVRVIEPDDPDVRTGRFIGIQEEMYAGLVIERALAAEGSLVFPVPANEPYSERRMKPNVNFLGHLVIICAPIPERVTRYNDDIGFLSRKDFEHPALAAAQPVRMEVAQMGNLQRCGNQPLNIIMRHLDAGGLNEEEI